MLIIVNVTPQDSTADKDDYEIRINERVIGKFKHKPVYNGAAQCLRDAADALDKRPLNMDMDYFNVVSELLDKNL